MTDRLGKWTVTTFILSSVCCRVLRTSCTDAMYFKLQEKFGSLPQIYLIRRGYRARTGEREVQLPPADRSHKTRLQRADAGHFTPGHFTPSHGKNRTEIQAHLAMAANADKRPTNTASVASRKPPDTTLQLLYLLYSRALQFMSHKLKTKPTANPATALYHASLTTSFRHLR